MNWLLPRWLAPHSMEPETPKPKGSQWFASFLHDLLACHVYEDGGGSMVTGATLLVSEMETSIKWVESSLSV